MWCETADNRSGFLVLIKLWEVRFKCMWEMVRCLCIYIYKHSLLSFPPSLLSSFLPSLLLSFLPLFLLPSVLLISTENQIITQQLIDVSVSSFLEITSPGVWNQWKEGVPAPRGPDWAPGCPVDMTLLPIPGSAFSHHLPGCSQSTSTLQIWAACCDSHPSARSGTLKCHHEKGEEEGTSLWRVFWEGKYNVILCISSRCVRFL